MKPTFYILGIATYITKHIFHYALCYFTINTCPGRSGHTPGEAGTRTSAYGHCMLDNEGLLLVHISVFYTSENIHYKIKKLYKLIEKDSLTTTKLIEFFHQPALT